jgi:hypothetical protein
MDFTQRRAPMVFRLLRTEFIPTKCQKHFRSYFLSYSLKYQPITNGPRNDAYNPPPLFHIIISLISPSSKLWALEKKKGGGLTNNNL